MLDAVQIVEVGPRDGIQSQSTLLSTDDKVTFVERLIGAGLRRIEVASFVNPKRVPQMADVDELIGRLPRDEGVSYIGLVLNRRGFDRAVESGIDEINCVVVATDTFNLKNQGVPSAQSMRVIEEIARDAREAGRFCGVTIGAAFGCPFEGEVAPARVDELVRALADMGVDEIGIADTIGCAVPSDVKRMLEVVMASAGQIPIRCHFHNTRNTGVANVFAALEMGVGVIDASCGGVGGCPFAPAATGNVATEDVLYMIDRMGIETGVSIEQVMRTTSWLVQPLRTQMPSMVSRAGLFPPPANTGE